MAALTIDETKVVDEFRKRVGDVLKTEEQNEDTFLIRWLRARDLDLNKAEDMLRKSFKWREENNIDGALLAKIDPFFTNEYLYSFIGHDKMGHPVVTCPIGKWDFRKIANEGKTEEFETYISHIFETMLFAIRKSNTNRDSELNRDSDLVKITQMTVIGDWSGYSYMQLVNTRAVQKIRHIASIYEQHHPEILFRLYFVGCPSFFNILLSLLKPILAPRTLGKIVCYGTNQPEWELALQEVIEPENLPSVVESLQYLT